MSAVASGTSLLSHGNTAKLYCLQRIAAAIETAPAGTFAMLDLGCGDAGQFSRLLERHPHVRFVGVEPDAGAAAAARRRLTALGVDHKVLTASAYDIDVGRVDVVTSFSVLEHVQRRDAYVRCIARHLAPGAGAFVNYDAGHFVGPGPPQERIREHTKTVLGRLRAVLGDDAWYQRFVPEAEARSLFAGQGLRVVDEKMFNCDLKTAFKYVDEESRDAAMVTWLETELAFNAAGVTYVDALARTFRTRCFELRLN